VFYWNIRVLQTRSTLFRRPLHTYKCCRRTVFKQFADKFRSIFKFSHDSEYEVGCVLDVCSVKSGRSLLTFQRYLLQSDYPDN
jgi:hypothetical protein